MKTQERKILHSILASIPTYGWTSTAITRGVKGAGISNVEAKKLFPHGIPDVVAAFHVMINEAMHEKIGSKRNFKTLRVRDKITFAVRVRLEAIEPYRDVVQRLLIWSLHPKNIRGATEELWRVADGIWVTAGDTSTDYNYYSKRLLLIAVMKSTLSFWLNDASANHQDTWEFLDRRIADVMVVGKGIGVIKAVGISDIVSLLRGRFAV